MLFKTHELSRFFSHVLAASVFGLHLIFCCYSFGSLVYAGNLSPYFPLGVNLILLGSISVTLIAAFFSSLPMALSGIQNDSLPLYSIVAVSVSSIIGLPDFNSTTLSTVIVSVGFATALSGLILLLLGSLKLGNLICFMPYPVIGGFLAGIGWFLFKGAFSVLLTQFPSGILQLFSVANLIQWLPAFLLACVLLVFQIWKPHHLRLPLCIIASVLLFYVIKLIANIPFSTLYHYNLLFHFDLSALHAHHVSIQDFSFSHIAWGAIFSQFNHILTIALLCAIGILLNATSLETLLKQELDFNHELRVAGIGNILSGCLGGMTGYLMLTFSALNYNIQKQMKPLTRAVAFYTAMFCILGVLMGNVILSYMPKFILGGLLMYFGMSYLKYWAWDARKMLPRSDYLLILVMLLIVGFVGLLQGILVGIIFSIISFIVKYSHTNVIKHMLSGNYFHSNKQYDPNTQHQLNRHGEEIFYFQLQNYLFFGNANSLLKKMHDIIAQYPSIHFVIFDFGRVTGVDFSAIMRFEKIKQFAEKENITIYFTNVDKKTKRQFIGSHVFSEQEIKEKFYANYDGALERCENEILQANHIASRKTILLEDRFAEFNEQHQAILTKLQRYFVRRVISRNEFIFHENDDLGDLYYIESGQVTVLLENSALSRQRLRTIGPGNTVGEVSLYSKQKRMASAVAEEECVLQILSYENVRKMEAEEPEVAIIFHKFIIHMLAERLAFANKQIEILRH